MKDGPGMPSIGLGFRAGRGGSVVIGIATTKGEPRLVLSMFLATAAAGDRLAFEPYHVAAEIIQTGQGDFAVAQAAVDEGRARQDRMAAQSLDALIGGLETRPVIAALLVNRAGWITDLLEHSLFAPEHPPVAEGLAVRDALRFAFDHCGVPSIELDEKTLRDTACKELTLAPPEIEARLKEFGATAGRPWRKEQQAAALAAWLAIARC